MAAKEWYKSWFSSPYYEVLYHKRNEVEAAAFIKRLLQYLNPPTGSLMLDVACGKGRHSNELADIGFDVTGIDLSEPFISEALKTETENLHFFVHDMRLPFYINYFNYAFNFFTSFGYFNTDREHNDAMRTIAKSLKPNGIFVIDYLNVHFAEDHLIKNEDLPIDGTVFHLNRWHDEGHFYKQIKIGGAGESFENNFTEKVAKFTLGDFTDMLAYQGMQVQEVFGDYRLGHYDIRKSPRMIIIAKKMVR